MQQFRNGLDEVVLAGKTLVFGAKQKAVGLVIKSANYRMQQLPQMEEGFVGSTNLSLITGL